MDAAYGRSYPERSHCFVSREALTTSELAMRFWRNRKHVVSASTGDDLVLMVDAISFANECRQGRLSPEAIPEQSHEKLIERARALKCSELGRDIYWNHESGACEFAADFYLRETEHGFAKLTPSAIERAARRISLLFAERLHQSKSNTEFLQEMLREELGVNPEERNDL